MNKVVDHKCPACAAVLTFKPEVKGWQCEYCDNKYTEADLAKVELEDDNNDDYINYKCQNCGAEIITDTETSSTFCIYCGNTAIMKNKITGKFRPSRLIPFKKTKEDAVQAFVNLKKGRPLMPRSFISENNVKKISGVYIPFWLHTVAVDGNIVVNAKNVSSWSDANYIYTKTDTYEVIREGSVSYNLIPTDGSSHFDNDLMNSLEPFDFKELIPFNHAYLSGFLAEKYNVESDEAYKSAVFRSENSTKQVLLNDIGMYTSKNIINTKFSSSKVNEEYVLLPVWMVTVQHEGKNYLFAMNGQTGEIIGDIPVSKSRTAIYSVVIFLIIFLVIFVTSLLAGGSL